MRLEVVAAQIATLDRETIRDVTLAVEFLTTALRAMVDGHPVASHMVQQPFLFAHGKINDLATIVYQKAA
ncbi:MULTISPECIES: hypothetical protein [unclassified Mesorhizobium]|uniref:hypothetical protein n=1 Tax=unclassified Mesorhizobium TaxID=325217 RepID=UPI0003CF2D59|nr:MULTISPECIES: hypothetical protein [unclassified Mesorhizobium]ESX98720.1 hypothetical protein X755_15320 [Mesorhizobium sp. LNJC405B00]ESY41995.1 hypothetical protein X747_14390 [Mesorhizobium sp. LNJC384A00]